MIRPFIEQHLSAAGFGAQAITAGLDDIERQRVTAKNSAQAKAAKTTRNESDGDSKSDPAEEIINGTLLCGSPSERADQAWALIREFDEAKTLFLFGDGVVEVSIRDSQVRKHQLSVSELADRIDRFGPWAKPGKDGTPEPFIPTEAFAKQMLSVADNPLPRLRSIVRLPSYTTTGRLLSTPGFDEESGMLYLPEPGLVIPAIPEVPLKEDVERAVELLRTDLLGDFPFATESDRTHFLCLWMLPIVRPMIPGPTPLHGIEASVQGSGKGLLRAVYSTVMGGGCAECPPTGSEEEMRKRIGGLLSEAGHSVVIDNLPSNYCLDSPSLAMVLTATEYSDRVLGHQKFLRLPALKIWLVTGNNIQLSGELARRYLRCRIEPPMERPHARPATGFRHPRLLDWARENRPTLLWASYVLVQNWLAKQTLPPRSLGSYEEWARVIGGIMAAANLPGFLESSQDAWDDSDTNELLPEAFFTAWHAVHPGEWMKARGLLPLAKEHGIVEGDRPEHAGATLLGSRLATLAGRTLGAYQLRRRSDRHAGGHWYRLSALPCAEPADPAEPSGTERMEGETG